MKRALAALAFALAAFAIATSPAGAAIEVTITSPAAGAHSLSGVVQVGVTASADAGIYGVQLNVDGRPYGTVDVTQTAQYQYVIPWDTTGLAAGDHTLTATAYDWSQPFPAGNQLNSSPVTVDVGPAYPTVSVASPQPWSFVKGTATIQLATTSALDPTTVAVTLDGQPVTPASTAPWTASWNTFASVEGQHTIVATITDGRGKAATSTAVVTVDNTKPSVALVSPAQNWLYFSGSLPVQATASDAFGVGTVQFAVDGTKVGPVLTQPDAGTTYTYSATLDLTALASGQHKVTAVATDQAGNTATSKAAYFYIGSSPPTATITLPPDWSYAHGTVPVTVNVSGGTAPFTAQLVIDGTATTVTGTGPAPIVVSWDTTKVADGSHTLAASVVDAQGRGSTSAAIHQTVDNTPPSASLISPTQSQRVNGPVNFQVNASDAFGVKQVQFLVDGAPVGAPLTAPDSGQQYLYSMSYDTTQLAVGMHTVKVTVTDNAGNTTTTPAVSIQTGPIVTPVATITVPPDWTYARGTVPVTVTVQGGTPPYTAQIVADGTATTSTGTGASPLVVQWDSTKVADGQHLVAASVVDSVGNGSTSAAIHQTVDNTPPSGFMISPTANQRVDGTITLQAHASDAWGVKQVQYLVDGNPVGAPLTSPDSGQQYVYSMSWDTTTVAAGVHTVAAQITDSAGNTATLSAVSVKTGPFQYMPVLNYHEIAPPDGYSIYDETPAEADAQMAYLQANGYTAVTLAQYQAWIGGQDIGIAKPVLITVDDGMADEMAWDTLFQKYGMRGVMFAITGWVDGNTPGDPAPNGSMTWAQLQSLATNGRWEIALHAGQYGHGDAFGPANGNATIRMSSTQTLSYANACPYFYSCLGTVATRSGTRTTSAPETATQAKTMITNEISAAKTELRSRIPTANVNVFTGPFNDVGQWTNLYNDASNAMQSWLPGFLAAQFQLVFTQTSPVQYGQASGTVGALDGFNRHYRFEVHTDTTIQQFAAALTDPAFVR
jgi:hypothetical protein